MTPQSRICIIKNNITVGTNIPEAVDDAHIGQFIDNTMKREGNSITNKSRKQGSTASYTVGSMTIQNIIDTPNWKDTLYFPKVQYQNQVTYSPDFNQIVKVQKVDMTIDSIQTNLKEGYIDCRAQLKAGCRNKEIKSKNGWVVFDGYGNRKSYRMRITNTAMKTIRNISSTKVTFGRLFDDN